MASTMDCTALKSIQAKRELGIKQHHTYPSQQILLCLVPILHTQGCEGAYESLRVPPKITGWVCKGSCPTLLSKQGEAAKGGWPIQGGSPRTGFPRPFHMAFDFLKGWRSVFPQLSLSSSAVRCVSDLVTRRYLSSNETADCISYIVWAEKLQRLALLILNHEENPYRGLIASWPCCTTRTDWRAVENQNRLGGYGMVSWPSGLKKYSRNFHANNRDRIPNISKTP